MQRHPSGCDPQDFRSRRFLNSSLGNARPWKPYDPVLEKLPGMQTALGELERSGPSLYRGTIERSNLNRLANDLTEILVRHVNHIRFQAKLNAQHSQEQSNVNHQPYQMPRKRARSVPHIGGSDHSRSRFNSPPGTQSRFYQAHESAEFSHRFTRSHAQEMNTARPQRKRRMIRYVYDEEEDENDVQDMLHVERPRRSKEIRENLNDDMAYEYMERTAHRKEQESEGQQQSVEAEAQKLTVIDDSSDDDDYDDEQGFALKVVCPKPYVRERALESDFASLTPIITDSDDDTDTEHARKLNARRVRRSVHDASRAQFVEKQCLVFPLGRKNRLIWDFVVDTRLMRNLAKEGVHHKNHRSILQTLPRIPAEHLEPGGRHWTDFEITEGFRKTSLDSLFLDSFLRRQQAAITANKTSTASLSYQASHGNNVPVEQRKYTHRPTHIGHQCGGSSGVKETSQLVEARSVDPEVCASHISARQQAVRNELQSRKLNGSTETLNGVNILLKQPEQQRIGTEPSDTKTGKSTAVAPPAAKTSTGRPQTYQQVRPIPAMKQVVGCDANQVTHHRSPNVTQRIDGDEAQPRADPSFHYAMQSNQYEQNLRMPYNRPMVLNSSQTGSSQVHAQYPQPVYFPAQKQHQIQSVPTHQQTSAIAQGPPGQRYLPQGSSHRLPNKEEVQAYQIMLQRGHSAPPTNPQILQIQAFQEWQRQVCIQNFQQQQMLQRQFQQRQQLLMPGPAQNLTSQNGPGIASHQVGRQFGNHANPASERHTPTEHVPEKEKRVDFTAKKSSATENGTPTASIRLQPSQSNMVGQESALVVRATQTGSLNQQNLQAAQATTPISGKRASPLKIDKLSSTPNALILPDSDAPLNPITDDGRLNKWEQPGKQTPHPAPRNPRRITSEASKSTPAHHIPSEVQLVRSQPQALPTSAVRGVPGWQWERLNYRVAQTNGLSAAQNQPSRSRASDANQNGGQNAQGRVRDHQRQYQEDYRAEYELQLRKVMEEIRKKSGGSSAGA
eukprot:TRINITY_DN3586_c0_g1_i1.p1 TRINITY_DN3586_c0_g1~~TRINITY_DN3586_c0_g1_i1.p1  ORF type:complete len:1012 (+),score=124.45 TRINITY_DN3586_c0_g1_i1:1932-4967(+)